MTNTTVTCDSTVTIFDLSVLLSPHPLSIRSDLRAQASSYPKEEYLFRETAIEMRRQNGAQGRGQRRPQGGASELPLEERAVRVFRTPSGVPCRIAHNPYDPKVGSPEHTPQPTQEQIKNPCKHFLAGQCNRGTLCRFYHPNESTVSLVLAKRTPPLAPRRTPVPSPQPQSTEPALGALQFEDDIPPVFALPPQVHTTDEQPEMYLPQPAAFVKAHNPYLPLQPSLAYYVHSDDDVPSPKERN